MKTSIGIGLSFAAMLSLAACHTVNGAGKDMRSAGKAVSEASGEAPKK